MIQSLSAPRPSFCGVSSSNSSISSSTRDAYQSVVDHNVAVAQEQNQRIANMQKANKIPMQGNVGQNLDVIA